MASHLDVAARLAEGREAVGHTATYVAACRQLGYRHPDLSGYGGQVDDWYDAETGLDLHLLDADCAQLWAAAEAAERVLQVQREQLIELGAGWRGPGADAAAAFLRGHCDAAEAVTARLRGAAQACATLRDDLWRCVDTKVAAVIAADERVGARAPAWLAAAHAVLTGTGDRHAEEVVEQQLTPHVDTDIGGAWLAAMRSARDGVTAAYSAAIAAADPGAGAVFAVPGELGPRYAPDFVPPVAPVSARSVGAPDVAPGSAAAPTVLSRDAPPPVPAGAPESFADPLSDAALPDATGLTDGLGLPGGLGMPGGFGMPGGGGLGGILPRIADAIGSLLGTSGDRFGEPDALSPLDGPADSESDDAPEDAVEAADGSGEAEGAQGDEAPAASGDAEQPDEPAPVQEVADEVPAEDSDAAPAGPSAAEAQSPPAEKTPCEIAAEELPQVGA